MFPARSFATALIAALISAAVTHAQSELVIHKEGATDYHRPGCPIVADGQNVLALTVAQANGRGLKPHADCDPAKTGATATTGTSPSKPAPVVSVLVDGSKYYHRDKCRKLGPDSARKALEEAGKKFWPCPVCKPPVRPRPTAPAVSHQTRR